MNRKIPIHISFYNDRWEKMISEGMAALHYEPVFLHGDVALSDIQDSEVLFGMFPPELLAQCPQLKWLQCSFAGVDTYTGPGVFVRPDAILTNASGAYGITISEHMICVLLMMMRRMPEYQALIAQRGWGILGDIRSIYGSTVTIIGMGDIGSNFGRRVRAMGASVIRGVRRTLRDKPDWADEVYTTEQLNDALRGADVVALCLPGTAGTKGILGQAQFDAMKDGAYVINVGRGTAIEQEALDRALRSGKLAGAALDVAYPEPLPQDHFLWDAPNLLLTPHVSGNMSLPRTCELVIDIFLRNLAHWDKGEALEHQVNRKQGY